ncbi:ABC-type branched-subunit amino acid transport system substrate-binding protein [Bacillus sp. SORGH_AS 510]|nr:ABC-type branched-subunit amino acid transport system substrate-binding protein [Bacillus sp. SORGH_AS_0510]
MKGYKGRWALLGLLIFMMVFASACSSDKSSSEPKDKGGEKTESKEPIKIGVLASKTGALEAYGKQTLRGFELGLDYATEGKMEVAGRKIEFIVEDTETKPEVAVQKATKLLEEDKVDFLVGSSSSADTLAVLPLAEEISKSDGR